MKLKGDNVVDSVTVKSAADADVSMRNPTLARAERVFDEACLLLSAELGRCLRLSFNL